MEARILSKRAFSKSSFRHAWYTRTLPIYFVGSPAILAFTAALPERSIFPIAGFATTGWLAILYFLGHVSTDAGRRIEQRLWSSWGGPPTTRFLLHTNSEFNSATRLRIHDCLRTLGLHIPSKEEEASDTSKAIEFYESAVDELRRRTRDTSKYPLVFQYNVEYGARRNVLGLRLVGVLVGCTGLAICGWQVWDGWQSSHTLRDVPLVCTSLNALIVVVWLFIARASRVKESAERYARFLLEAACALEAK